MGDLRNYNNYTDSSKWLTLSLSAIVPGLGQVYLERYIDGIITLAAIAGTFYGSYYFYQRGEMPASYTFAFFTALFYAGNLYGAYNSVTNFQSKRNERYSSGLINKYVPQYHPMDYLDLNRSFK